MGVEISEQDLVYTEVTPREALLDYLAGLPGTIKPRSIHHKRAHLRKLIDWMEDSKANGYDHELSLAEIRIPHMRRYLAYRETTAAVGQTTRYHDMTQARCFFDYCRSVGYMRQDPMAGIKVTKPRQQVKDIPSDHDVTNLLAAVQRRWNVAANPHVRFTGAAIRTFMRYRDYAMISLLAETGARNSEIMDLKLSDIHRDNPPADPDKGSQPTVTFRHTKTDVDRDVPVTRKWLAALDQWLRQRPAASTCENVFVTVNGEPVEVGWFGKKMRPYAEMAGCPGVTPQSLRRYRLSKIANLNLYVASELGGNSPEVLRRYYVKKDDEVAREVWQQTMLRNVRSERQRRRLV